MFRRRLLDHLEKWQNRSDRKPLVLRGARQVGKTSLVKLFAEKNFASLIYFNLDNPEHRRFFNQPLAVSDVDQLVQVYFHQKIVPGKTLIFLDEIQNSVNAVNLLRLFYENKPEIHLIAAGSLLEAKIVKEGWELPVGRVEYAYLYPLDFFEYLAARGEAKLLTALRQITTAQALPVKPTIHLLAQQFFQEYLLIGGMPEAVASYLEFHDLAKIKNLFSNLVTAYSEDVYKYASTATAEYLAFVILNAPLLAGSIFTYENFGFSNYRSREMKTAFDLLEKAMILTQVRATSSQRPPLLAKEKRPKKLIFLDVGFTSYLADLYARFWEFKKIDTVYQGRLLEQAVGQNLLAQFATEKPHLFYWAKDKPRGSAEIDFCLTREGRILGLEVKAGENSRSRSAVSFLTTVKDASLLKFSAHPGQIEVIAGQRVVSLPCYLAPTFQHLTK